MFITTDDNKLWRWDKDVNKYINIGDKQSVFCVPNLLSLQSIDSKNKNKEIIYCTEDTNYLYIYNETIEDFVLLYRDVIFKQTIYELQSVVGDKFTLGVVGSNKIYRWNDDDWLEVDDKKVLTVAQLPVKGKNETLYVNITNKTIWYYKNNKWIQIAGNSIDDSYFILRFDNIDEMLNTQGNANVFYLLNNGLYTTFYHYDTLTKKL